MFSSKARFTLFYEKNPVTTYFCGTSASILKSSVEVVPAETPKDPIDLSCHRQIQGIISNLYSKTRISRDQYLQLGSVVMAGVAKWVPN